ncbi:MAG: PKD domain-containing protein, partial [Rhodothermales bacterium]|nr:PKD domain-containing protein [Rhodothermales bacterium]
MLSNLTNSVDQERRVADIWDTVCGLAPDGHDRRQDPGCLLLQNPKYVNRFSANRFTLTTKYSDEILLGVVNVCTSLDNSQCLQTPVRDLVRRAPLLRKFVPTHAVTIGGTGPQNRIHLGLASDDDGDAADCYNAAGDKTLDGEIDKDDYFVWPTEDGTVGRIEYCESRAWFNVASKKVGDAYTRQNLFFPTADMQYFWIGVAGERTLHGDNPLGIADLFTSAIIKFTDELIRDQETLAHEVGHLIGIDHTFGDDTDWPYESENLVSGESFGIPTYEVGLDVQARFDRRAAKNGEEYVDVMSYRIPAWISPYHYNKMLEVLGPAPADPTQYNKILEIQSHAPSAPPSQAREFWLVSGFLNDQSAILMPVFEFDGFGRIDFGSGTHRIEVWDAGGSTLFTRYFTPLRSNASSGSGRTIRGLPAFSEMIPVEVGAATIAVLDESDIVRKTLTLGGAVPDVAVAGLPDGRVNGHRTVSWTATDADSNDLVFWIEYSPDNGSTWSTLAQARYETNLEVDFDALPGSNGNSLIRVLASDGINTGSAVSNNFSVTAKPPEAEILAPQPGDKYFAFAGTILEGFAFDLEDGLLRDSSLAWESDRLGFLGNGERLVIPSIPVGDHTVTLVVTDNDGNIGTDSVTFTALDGVPTEVPAGPSPIADAGGPYVADEGETIPFDGSGSFDPDGGVLVYGWDFGDGSTGSGVSSAYSYVDDGEFDVTLAVVDPQGLRTIDMAMAVIRNVSPDVLSQPGPSGVEGETLILQGSFSDPGLNDGPWQVFWNFGDGATDRDESATPGEITSSHIYDEAGAFSATVTVTDKDGSASTGFFEVEVGAISVDSDGDGVSDADDQCPGTPAGAAVDADGCSTTQLDSDGDGVSDADDQCPGTAAGAAVDADGCSTTQLDSDGDGVSDADDQCSGTAADAAVDADGCSTTQLDSDGDGVSDADDNCPNTPNLEQTDTDGNGIGDLCDRDDFPVAIDIRPFSSTNRIWPRFWGAIPVAIQGSEQFDSLQVAVPTVRFGPNGAKAIVWLTG